MSDLERPSRFEMKHYLKKNTRSSQGQDTLQVMLCFCTQLAVGFFQSPGEPAEMTNYPDSVAGNLGSGRLGDLSEITGLLSGEVGA